jgi:hypothetical protein
MIKQFPSADVTKGKEIISYSPRTNAKAKDVENRKEPKLWERPARGRLKLNVYGSFLERTA